MKFIVKWIDTNSLCVDADTEEEAIENVKKLYDDDNMANDVLISSEYSAQRWLE